MTLIVVKSDISIDMALLCGFARLDMAGVMPRCADSITDNMNSS